MRKYLLLILTVGVTMIIACAQEEPAARKDLTQQQRDSILAGTPLPGAKVVGKAISISDSASARAKRLDEGGD